MLFSSLHFILFFFPLFLLLYFTAQKRRTRNIILLIFSLVFYAWGEPLYIFLMLLSLAANYVFALLIDRYREKAKIYLVLDVILNLGLLGVYKYTGFVINTLNLIPGVNLPGVQIALPIGISFYTFQIMSYVIDVYRKETAVQRSIAYLGAWIAILAYTLQIYFDFSGYSDMAIGMGRMMGFHYLENFNYPYISTSVTDFWRRWHISLSTFFRDYVYIPLGGNRVSKPRWLFNIAVVWMLTGLWHGASWNFILWGVYFGVLLILEKLFWGKTIEKIPVIRHIYAVTAFVFGWVLFRAETLTQTGEILRAMFGGYGMGGESVRLPILLQSVNCDLVFVITFIIGMILATPVYPKLLAPVIEKSRGGKIAFDVVLILLLFMSAASIAVGSYNPFIYFRF